MKLSTPRKIVGAASLAIVLFLLILSWPNVRQRRQVAFMAATLQGNVGRMKLLLALGASPEAPACNTSLCPRPLFAAALDGHEEAVLLLLDRGADINGKMTRGQSALIAAAYEGHTDIVKLLLSRGANVNADWEGCTALDSARQKDHAEIVDLLQRAGAKDGGHC